MLSSQAFDRGWNVEILGDEVDEKNLMQPLQWQQQEFYRWYQFAFFQTFCEFFNWVNLLEISIGEHSWGLILGTVSKIKNLKQRAALLGLLSSHQWDTTSLAVFSQQMLSSEKYPFLLFKWVYIGVSWPPSHPPPKKLRTKCIHGLFFNCFIVKT